MASVRLTVAFCAGCASLHTTNGICRGGDRHREDWQLTMKRRLARFPGSKKQCHLKLYCRWCWQLASSP